MQVPKNYVLQQINSLIVDYLNNCIYIVKVQVWFSLLVEQEQWISTKTIMLSKQNNSSEIHFVTMAEDLN